MAGLPPAYLKLGKSVVYDEGELDRFLATCRRRSTSEPDNAEQKTGESHPGSGAAIEPGGFKLAEAASALGGIGSETVPAR